jgi:pyruvate,water dikinase
MEQLSRYMDEFGRRGDDLNFERPSWIEDPTPVLQNLRILARQAARGTDEAAIARDRERATAQARGKLAGYPAPVLREFDFLLRAAQQAVVLTEEHNFWIDMRGLYCVRQVAMELGRRLADAGQIANAADVFYLTVDDLRETLSDSSRLFQDVVARRLAEVRHFASAGSPPVIPSPDLTRSESGGGAGMSPQLLLGQPCSPGKARGTARVLRSLNRAGELRQGEVLVAQSLTPSWSPLFMTACAVVADAGGILSHAAIAAREYGVPAVLDAGAATAAIRDGQLIEVDGHSGTVRLLEG